MAPYGVGSASQDSTPAAQATTDYDTWCEYGTICRRKINAYISETKGNAAYGNQNGVIGSYDVVLRTNLNGRQANSTLAFMWDSGPSLSFYNTGIRCMEYPTTFIPALNCGWHNVSPMWVGRQNIVRIRV